MSALTFDTHQAIKTLMAGGAEPQLAEAVTQVIKQAQDANLERLATKGDISRVEALIADTKVELIKWVTVLLLAQAGLVAALVKLL